MADSFDPYEKWLGIPKSQRPLTCYLLLGLDPFEEDTDAITDAARERIDYVRQYQTGSYAKVAKKMLGQIAEAEACLLDPTKKAKYDEKLRKQGVSGNGRRPSGKKKPPSKKPPKGGKKSAKASSPVGPESVFDFGEESSPTARVTGTGIYSRRRSNPWPMVIGLGLAFFVLVFAGVFMMMNQSPAVAEKDKEKQSEEAEKGKEGVDEPIDEEDPLAPKGGGVKEEPGEENNPDGGKTKGKGKTQPMPEPEPEPEPMPEPEPAPTEDPIEPDSVEWAVAVDPPQGGVPPMLDKDRISGLKPGFSPTTFGIDPTHQAAAVGAPKDNVEVFDLASGAYKCTRIVRGEKILAVAMTAPDKLLVWSDGAGIQRFAATSGKSMEAEHKYSIPFSPIEGEAFPERGLSVSPGGNYMALVRRGLRIYRVDDGKLSGIIPTPVGEQVIGQGFTPDGKYLAVIYAATRRPFNYRVVPINVETGKPEESRIKTRPGDLLSEDLRGGIYFRQGKNGRYLFLGNQFILNQDDGRIVSLVAQPPALAVPLQNGEYWTAGKSGVGYGSVDWKTVEESVRSFDLAPGAVQFHPDFQVAVDVQVDSTSANDPAEVTARVKATMEQALKLQGFIVSDASSSKVIVRYSEAAGKAQTMLPFYDENGLVQQKMVDSFEGVLPKIEVELFSGETKERLWWSGKLPVFPAEIVCTAEQAEMPAKEAFAQAAVDCAAARAAGLIHPFFYFKGILGTNFLPVQANTLK